MRHRRSNFWNRLRARYSPTAVFNQATGTTNGIPSTTVSSLSSSSAVSSARSLSSSSSSTSILSSISSSSTSSSSSSSSGNSSSISSTSSSTTTSISKASSLSSSSDPPVITPPSTRVTTINLPLFSSSHTPTSLASSSTSSATPSSGVSTGALVGGIAAGIVGVIGVGIALIYFLRRWKRDEDDGHFDSDVFKRQSAILSDGLPPTRSLSRSPGASTPRPPTMIERHMANTTPSPMSPQFGYPYQEVNYNHQYNNSGYNSPGFHPGEVVAAPYQFYPYGDSAMGSPAAMGPYEPTYHGDISPRPSQAPTYLSRQPSSQAPTYLSRQPSATVPPSAFSNSYNSSQTYPVPSQDDPVTSNILSSTSSSEGQYVDLSRASITPYQASQYQEISRRLDIPPPVSKFHGNADPILEESPFGDPIVEASHMPRSPPPVHSVDTGVASVASVLPPSPVYRIDPDSRDPVPVAGPSIPAAARVTRGNRPDTVYTLYDDEDAYGGI